MKDYKANVINPDGTAWNGNAFWTFGLPALLVAGAVLYGVYKAGAALISVLPSLF